MANFSRVRLRIRGREHSHPAENNIYCTQKKEIKTDHEERFFLEGSVNGQ